MRHKRNNNQVEIEGLNIEMTIIHEEISGYFGVHTNLTLKEKKIKKSKKSIT